jgi:hypothetical protein
VQVSSIHVLDPSIRAARDEAIQVCNQEGSIRSQHARHLLQAQAKIRYVDECQVADDKVKARFERVEPAAAGRPSYHPSVLKLYIYGYLI